MGIADAEYHIYSSHGKNLNDRGGSIMQKRKYLLAYNRWDDKSTIFNQSVEKAQVSFGERKPYN